MTGRMATILVVEDEHLVRELTADMLQALGYEVLLAETGRAALEIISKPSAEGIDFVLLDLSLPDFDGMQLMPEFLRQIPTLRIILCSGSSGADVDPRVLPPQVSFLAKPFSLQQLEQALEKGQDAF